MLPLDALVLLLRVPIPRDLILFPEIFNLAACLETPVSTIRDLSHPNQLMVLSLRIMLDSMVPLDLLLTKPTEIPLLSNTLITSSRTITGSSR